MFSVVPDFRLYYQTSFLRLNKQYRKTVNVAYKIPVYYQVWCK
jgi:hypothetical protein